jgi:hypothetical protein
MSNYTLIVVLGANGNIAAVADPSKAPDGMAYSIAAKTEHLAYEVQTPENLMQLPHVEMKRFIKEQIDAGACKPHLFGRVKSQKST